MSQIDNRACLLRTETIQSSEQTGGGVCLEGFPIIGLIVPAMNGTPEITVDVSVDGGTTWLDLLDADGSADAIEIIGGAAAFAVSSDVLTPLAAYAGRDFLVRLVSDVAQTAQRDFGWVMLA